MTTTTLDVLVIEDNAADAELMIRELEQARMSLQWTVVDTAEAYVERLDHGCDLILSDYHLPQFDAPRALHLLQQRGLDIPFIVVTGSISEEVAVDIIKQGATDYLLKDRLSRLSSAAQSALEQQRLRSERRQAQQSLQRYAETQRVLALELDHRVRNNLSALLSLVDMTRRSVRDVDQFAAAITGRVQTMAVVHSMLSQSNWQAIDMADLLEAMIPQTLRGRISISGPPASVHSRQVTALAIVLHEVMDACIDQGALSRPQGRTRITWTARDVEDNQVEVTLDWVDEQPDRPLSAAGFDEYQRSIVSGLVKSDLGGAAVLDFNESGSRHWFRFRLDQSPYELTAKLTEHASQHAIIS